MFSPWLCMDVISSSSSISTSSISTIAINNIIINIMSNHVIRDMSMEHSQHSRRGNVENVPNVTGDDAPDHTGRGIILMSVP